MELYNCESREELELRDLNIKMFTNKELVSLSEEIKELFNDCVLQDETIVIDALTEIIKEIGLRSNLA